jgi:hypothetical protein
VVKIILPIIFAFCTALPASADMVKTMGAGANAACIKWLGKHDKDWFQMGQWALGYLSGAARYSETLNPLEGLDADAVSYWINNYCQQHPLATFTAALDAFVHEHSH